MSRNERDFILNDIIFLIDESFCYDVIGKDGSTIKIRDSKDGAEYELSIKKTNSGGNDND
jgi:hypothetical protein